MNVEDRLADIERRLTLLEGSSKMENPMPLVSPPKIESLKSTLVALRVSNKRYDHGEYENHIWFDCTYTLLASAKPTRAVKGVIEFCDLFGDAKFRINVTINDPLQPSKALSNPGIGFTYNQFMAEHQWMLATELNDMQCRFVALNVLYADGTSEKFA